MIRSGPEFREVPPLRVQLLVEIPFVMIGTMLGAEIGNVATQLLAGVPIQDLAVLTPSAELSERVNVIQNFYATIGGALIGMPVSANLVTRFTRRSIVHSSGS